jgi:hypothetical protein
VLAPLALASALALCGQSPNDSLCAAYADLNLNVAPEKRYVTRYESLVAVPLAQRSDYLKALAYAHNATSFRSVLAQLVPVGDMLLLSMVPLRKDLHAACIRAITDAASLAPLPVRSVVVGPNIVLSLGTLPPEARGPYLDFLKVVVRNPLHQAVIDQSVFVGDTALVRVDLEAFEWDYGARSVRLKELERRGVDFGLKETEARRLFLDPWEQFARDDPFFQVGYYDAEHRYVRGWLDPTLVNVARHCTNSIKPVLRADWLCNRLLTESFPPAFNGYYSTLLMLPKNEADLYKVMLVDIKAITRESSTRRGGAVLESGVARHARELQLVPGTFGFPVTYVWRTFDFAVDAAGDKSVIDSPGGTVKHDGREIIGSLPNGLIWTFLCDGGTNNDDGKQVGSVPDTIAYIKTPIKSDLIPVRDTRVINSYKCLECHGPSNGIIPFDDVIAQSVQNRNIALLTYGSYYQVAQLAALKAQLENYYLSPLPEAIKLHQDAFAAQLRKCCGLSGFEAAATVIRFVEGYIYNLVSVEQAAREVGYPVEQTTTLLRNAYNEKTGKPNSTMVVLSTGRAQGRGVWEQGFGDVMRAQRYSWESAYPSAKAKGR